MGRISLATPMTLPTRRQALGGYSATGHPNWQAFISTV